MARTKKTVSAIEEKLLAVIAEKKEVVKAAQKELDAAQENLNSYRKNQQAIDAILALK